jgi:hypothetical protein
MNANVMRCFLCLLPYVTILAKKIPSQISLDLVCAISNFPPYNIFAQMFEVISLTKLSHKFNLDNSTITMIQSQKFHFCC